MAEVMRPEKLEISNDTSSLASPELLHVLAVDDSIVDRKFIERLLRVSSCKGTVVFCFVVFFVDSVLGFRNLTMFFFNLILSVTVVDSATRALQYLGLDGENNTVGFEVNRSHDPSSFFLKRIH